MADVIELEEVQTWLETTKLSLGDVPADLADVAQTTVFAALAETYTTTSWVDVASTPALVRKIIAMFTAAWYYKRQYAEVNSGDESYGSWLESKAQSLLDAVLNGTLQLTEVSGSSSVGQPAFFPNDTTGSTQQYDAAGNAIGSTNSEDIKFHMGTVF